VNNSIAVAVFVASLSVAGAVAAQNILLDAAADKAIQKFQGSTCEQLKAQKDEPKSDQQKQAIDFLRNDAQARGTFIGKIAPPILNKMFECGLIP
jgi:hypothetical protein